MGSEHANITIALLLLAISFLVIRSIARARRGERLFLRRIPGISAVDEAAGRAAEMGRPLLFTAGLSGLEIVTFAGLAVLRHVARIAARLGSRLIVSISVPEVFPVAEEVCRQAYQEEGRGDAFRAEDVRYLCGGQFAWALATMGIIIRERAASTFFFGHSEAESLMLAESGNVAGAIQMAGTPDLYQIPFYIAACDYTVFGEEYYAASAYLSQDPVMTGSLVAQDYGKMIFLGIAILGALFATAQYLGWIPRNYLLELVQR